MRKRRIFMSLINYKDINCEPQEKENKIIDFGDNEIQIVPCLSSQDKYDLIMITLQKSLNKNVYNPFLIDLYFDLNVLYLYTNIVFSVEDRADEAALYDTCVNSGLMALVLSSIDKKEYNTLKSYTHQMAQDQMKYQLSFVGILDALKVELPKLIDKYLKPALESVDMASLQEAFKEGISKEV